MNTRNFRNALALPALIAVGLLGNTAPIRGQSMILQHPVGSWLYTVTIPVDGDPADNIVFQGVETYMLGGGYIETDQLSFSPTLGLSTPSHGSWASTGGSNFLMTYLVISSRNPDDSGPLAGNRSALSRGTAAHRRTPFRVVAPG